MLVAQLYREDARKAKRKFAGREATLRDAVERPIDIVVEDLSIGGFGMSTTEDLPVGCVLNLRLPGIGKRKVRVVRRFGLNYGCEFAQSLSDAELGGALNGGSVVTGSFMSPEGSTSVLRARDAKLTTPLRVGVLGGMVGVLWLAILLAVDHLIKRS